MGSCESHLGGSSKTEMEEKEKRDNAMKALAVGAGLLLGSRVLSRMFEGSNRKTMKAPGRDFYIYRDDFENDPAAYFRRLRDC